MGRSSLTVEDHILTTAIAIDKDKSSQYAVKWAIDNLLDKKHHCILVHVRNQSSSSMDPNPVPKGGRPPTESEMHQLFLPYRGFCARKGVEAKEVILHDIEVSSALIDFIISNSISNIIVGASSRNAFTRVACALLAECMNHPLPLESRDIGEWDGLGNNNLFPQVFQEKRSIQGFGNFKKLDVPAALTKNAPEFCTVYVIAKGKVQSCRSSSQPCTPTTAFTPRQPSQIRISPKFPPESPVSEDISRSSTSESWRSVSSGLRSISSDRSSDSIQTTPSATYSGSKIRSPLRSMENMESSTRMRGNLSHVNSLSVSSDYSGKYSFLSTDMSYDNLELSYASGSPMSSLFSSTPHDLDAEMNKLRLELKQNMEVYNAACKETLTVDQRGKELHQRKTEEARKLEEAKHAEETAISMAVMEKQRSKVSMEASQMAQHLAELEVQKRKYVEMKAKHEALALSNIQYRRYTIGEIEVATDYFSNSLKIGEGGYGPVYRASLDNTAVAIKVLRPDLSQGQAQFQQEVEVLSGMRHPNMVLLVGACPEYGCLVYEYMENGSLEDRLFQKDNSPPIPWKTRFKISAEIATALLFLHQTKPDPLVHRDLKPANILIDSNYVSKISDVGLARLVPASIADSVTQYHMTAAAGTFCYIDPEYQQTGMLGVKSDVYSLGVMLLQIITAKPPMGLTHQVERAIESGKFVEVLDQAVTDWPIEEALSYAKLALQCCELRKKDRPDLCSVVVPELNRLRDFGLHTGDGHYSSSNYGPNSHSISDASQEGMRYIPNVEMEIQHRSIPEEGGSSGSSLSEEEGL